MGIEGGRDSEKMRAEELAKHTREYAALNDDLDKRFGIDRRAIRVAEVKEEILATVRQAALAANYLHRRRLSEDVLALGRELVALEEDL